MSDYIPRNDSELALWLSGLSKGLATHGATVNLTDAEIKAEQKRCADLAAAIANDDQKRREWLAATEATRTLKEKELPALRAVVARIKVATGYTPAIGQALGVISSPPAAVAPENIKPVLRAQHQGGQVEIRFTRGKLDGINLYVRKRGESEWRPLGRVTRSPYVDPTPVDAKSGSEIREYRAYGVRRDQEIGQPSDIVVVASGDK
ncbi:MAG: hypothetical protein U1A78_16815 [Polyangia bacterium]